MERKHYFGYRVIERALYDILKRTQADIRGRLRNHLPFHNLAGNLSAGGQDSDLRLLGKVEGEEWRDLHVKCYLRARDRGDARSEGAIQALLAEADACQFRS